MRAAQPSLRRASNKDRTGPATAARVSLSSSPSRADAACLGVSGCRAGAFEVPLSASSLRVSVTFRSRSRTPWSLGPCAAASSGTFPPQLSAPAPSLFGVWFVFLRHHTPPWAQLWAFPSLPLLCRAGLPRPFPEKPPDRVRRCLGHSGTPSRPPLRPGARSPCRRSRGGLSGLAAEEGHVCTTSSPPSFSGAPCARVLSVCDPKCGQSSHDSGLCPPVPTRVAG